MPSPCRSLISQATLPHLALTGTMSASYRFLRLCACELIPKRTAGLTIRSWPAARPRQHAHPSCRAQAGLSTARASRRALCTPAAWTRSISRSHTQPVQLGSGLATFCRAKVAMQRWAQMELGWVTTNRPQVCCCSLCCSDSLDSAFADLQQAAGAAGCKRVRGGQPVRPVAAQPAASGLRQR